jgi:hypothetical protein
MAVWYMADDQHRWMRNKVFPIRGRRRPCLGVCSPALPGTWRPTVRQGRQGCGSRQHSRGRGQGQGRGRERGFCGADTAAIVQGRIRQRHHLPDAGSHGPGPAPVGGMACQPSRLWPGGHLARPQRGARGRMVKRPPRGVSCEYCFCGRWWWLWQWCVKVSFLS